MSDSNQLSMSGILWGVASTSLLVAVATTHSFTVAISATLILCLFAGCYCYMNNFGPIQSGAVVGFLPAAMLTLNVLVTTVLKAEVVQGHLYTEDGPFPLFLVCGIFLIVGGAICAAFGSLVWTILAAVSNRNWEKFEAANEEINQQ